MQSITRAARAAIPNYNGEFALQAAATRATIVATGLRWPGIHWDLTQVLLRLEWVGVSLGLVLLAAPFFDRFDPTRARNRPVGPNGVRPEGERRSPLLEPAPSAAPVHLSSLGSARSWGFYRMFRAELRLALKGSHWWWYALAGGLVVAQCASPLEISRGPLLTAAWIWPLLLWSAMGVREARHGTQQLIFSAPRVLPRQLPAGWLVGVLIAVATGGGVAVRLLLARNYSGFLGWSAGALFIPTLALALGVWTGSSRAFEGFYTGLWYIGPLNQVRGLDFTGGANGAHTVKDACLYLALAAALFACAMVGRWGQLRRG